MVNVPNTLTILRITLIPFFVWLMLEERFGEALAVFVLGSISDGLDGYFARKLNQITAVGKLLDPLADKLFVLASYTTSYMINLLPLWMLVLVFIKEIVMLCGVFTLYLSIRTVEIRPTLWGKATTALQMTVMVFILLSGLGVVTETILIISFVVTAIFMAISTADYVKTGIKAYREAH